MARKHPEQVSEELIAQAATALRASAEVISQAMGGQQSVEEPVKYQPTPASPHEGTYTPVPITPSKSVIEKINELPEDLKKKGSAVLVGTVAVGLTIGTIYSGQVEAEKDNCTDANSRQIVVESGKRADVRAFIEKAGSFLPGISAASQGEQTLGGVRNMLIAERGYTFSERSFREANKKSGIIKRDDEGKVKDTIPSGTYCVEVPAPAFYGYQWIDSGQTLKDLASANLTTPENLQKLNPALTDYKVDEKLPEGILVQVDPQPNKEYVYREMDKSEKDINTASDGDEKMRNELLRVNAAILGTGGSVSSGNEAWLSYGETEWMEENEVSVNAVASSYSFASLKLRAEKIAKETQKSENPDNEEKNQKTEKTEKDIIPSKFAGKLIEATETELKMWPKKQTDNWAGVENNNPYIKKYTEGKLGPEVSWCAYFVRYAMNEAGANIGVTEQLGGKSYYMPRVKDMWNWMVSGYNKDFYVYSRDSILEDKKTDYKPGDIIFFNYYKSEEKFKASNGNHVGIITAVGNNDITIVDGNYFKTDTVDERKINRNDPQIMGISRAIEAGATLSGIDIPPQLKLSQAESERVTDILAERGPEWENRAKAMRFLIDQGFEDYQAAGLIGNAVIESAGVELNPSIVQIGGGPGRGIIQWEMGARFDTISGANLVDFAKSIGKPWNTLDTQLKFIMHEFSTTEKAAYIMLKNSKNVREATSAVLNGYERPAERIIDRRLIEAEKILAEYRNVANRRKA